MARNSSLRAILLSIAALTLATCVGPEKGEKLRYDRPFLGRQSAPRELDWLKHVRLAAYAALPTNQDKQQFVAEIDADLMDWYCTYTANSGNFMRKQGIRVAGPEEFEYQEALQFSKPDTEAIFADNGIAIKLDGTRATFPPTMYRGSYFMCHNAPQWHEMVTQGLLRLVPFGDSITQDNIGCPLNKGQGNFCAWCNAGFKRYLRERFSPIRIRLLGIRDLDSFDARAYIQGKVKAGGNETAVADPLVREYIRFQYISEANAWEDIMRAIRAESAQLGLPMRAVYGNQYGAWGTMPFATALSSRSDVVWIECNAMQPTWADDKQAWNALVYKIGLAAGHFTRPVWTWPIGYSDNQVFLRSKMKLDLKKSSSGEPYVGRLKRFPIQLVLCEGLAEGGMAVMRPGNSVGTDVYGLHADYARFVAQNRALFGKRTRYVNVGLIYSFPTWMWRKFSSLAVKDLSADYLPAIARVLEEAHIPYEANVFGHPDLWDDTEVLKSLPKYDAIILPSVDCLSDRQADALWSYVRGGGALICCGEIGTRDEDFNRRPTPALAEMVVEGVKRAEAGLGLVVQIPKNDISEFLDSGTREIGYQKLRNLVVGVLKNKTLLTTNAPRTVWINSWSQENGRRLCVHLLNYDADVAADVMIPAKNIEIALKVPKGFALDRVMWIPLGRETRVLEHRVKDGRVVFTVPEVGVYGVAVLTKGNELIVGKGVADAQTLRERLNVALEDRGGCPPNIRDLIAKAEDAMAKAEYSAAAVAANQVLPAGMTLLNDTALESINAERRSRVDTIVSASKAALAFDFGNGPVAPGWKGVRSDAKYDPRSGFGWDNVEGLRGSEGSSPDPLHGDCISADVTRTFSADLPNGDYIVTLVCGHPSAVSTRAATAVAAEGATRLLGVRSYAGVFFNRSFSVKVSDGRLDLTFPAVQSPPLAARADGPKPFAWNVCGVLVRKAGEGPAPPDLALNDALAQGGLTNWAVAGPFDDSGCQGMAVRYAPETYVDLGASYEGKKGRKISWKSCSSGAGIASISFRELFDDEERVVAFAHTKIYAPSGKKVRFFFGSTGVGQVWLNEKPLLRDYTLSGLMADELKREIELKQGRNDLLVKVCSPWGGAWGFSASILDMQNQPIPGLKTAPAGQHEELASLSPAWPVAYPSIETESASIEFNKPTDVTVVAENVSSRPMDGELALGVDEALKDSVRIEAAGPAAFAGVKPGDKVTKRCRVALLRLPADVGSVSLRAVLKTAEMSRTATCRLKVVAPKVLLSAYNPEREPDELVLDSMDSAAAWKATEARGVYPIIADTLDKKEGKASLSATRVNNGDGVEDFGRIETDFPDDSDWTAYNTLRFWAKVTDQDPTVKKRPICVVLNNRDSGGYQPLARHEIPVGEWTRIEDDISSVRREDVSSLVPHLYETYLNSKYSYTWRLDDLRLLKASQSRPTEEKPGPDQVAVRLYISNPTSTPVEAALALALPTGWRCDLPEGTKVVVPAKRAWGATCRLTTPPNLPGLAGAIQAKLTFSSGAQLEARQEIQPPKRLSLGAVRKPPVMDGKLDDDCWKTSPPLENFTLNDGAGLAKAQTRAWACRDAANLYIAFECLEPDMRRIKADVKTRDGEVWTDDCVEVFIEPGGKPSRDLYHLVFNTLDVLRDEGPSGSSWNSHAKSKTQKGKDRWTIEIAIPFADLGGAPRPGETWLLNLNRSRQARPARQLPPAPAVEREFSCWSCTYGPFATPERFGEIVFE